MKCRSQHDDTKCIHPRLGTATTCNRNATAAPAHPSPHPHPAMCPHPPSHSPPDKQAPSRCGPEAPSMCARLRPTPPAAAHEELASGLPPALRRVLVDCEPPSAVSAADLAAALSLPPPPPPAASLRSLRMLRMLRGQPPELEPEAETPPFVLREAGVLSHAACAALRAAVDAHLDCNAGCPAEAPAAQVRQHLLASAFSSQLVLDRPALERVIGAPAVQRLWRIPAAVRAGRTEATGGGAGPVISRGAPVATAPPP
eukprot:scaffold7126_cov114-Isochrysis_galbana.AAC.1